MRQGLTCSYCDKRLGEYRCIVQKTRGTKEVQTTYINCSKTGHENININTAKICLDYVQRKVIQIASEPIDNMTPEDLPYYLKIQDECWI